VAWTGGFGRPVGLSDASAHPPHPARCRIHPEKEKRFHQRHVSPAAPPPPVRNFNWWLPDVPALFAPNSSRPRRGKTRTAKNNEKCIAVDQTGWVLWGNGWISSSGLCGQRVPDNYFVILNFITFYHSLFYYFPSLSVVVFASTQSTEMLYNFLLIDLIFLVTEGVSSCLTAHQHKIGYLVPL